VRAEFVAKPDANTLWLEDGRDIQVGTPSDSKKWRSSLAVAALPEGGFSLGWKSDTERSGGRYVPVSSEYPYLVFEITGFEFVGKQGYRGFSVFVAGGSIGMEGNLQKGVYQVDARGVSGDFLRFYVYGADIHFKYLEMVKRPDTLVTIQCPGFSARRAFGPGDALTFTVNLKAVPEDVAVRLVSPLCQEPILLNGLDRIQLKPKAGDRKTWTATVQVKALGSGADIPAGGVLVKTTVLDGVTNAPFWSVIPYRYNQGVEDK